MEADNPPPVNTKKDDTVETKPAITTKPPQPPRRVKYGMKVRVNGRTGTNAYVAESIRKFISQDK